ncbi:leucine-rich repeat-containing protein 74A-like isoform X1 [Leptidea sinapis]|uniref:leucine-rich repeat-containing protein 74A-like isoform X1 n=1 Tax=Leptidea sinapis TaxID=189913 RepID=UPI0021C42737|nr:leucine-rich repeat-containing protein 74A-like isoform X1 [Leptidea sinapis]
MSSTSTVATQLELIPALFKNVSESSSSDPPMEEWSSLAVLVQNQSQKFEQKELSQSESENILCAQYVSMSASSILLHPYYSYPCIEDPGIVAALLKPETTRYYPPDGQEYYLAVCEAMDICPVRSFYRGLLQLSIDLKYYGVNPGGVRAMCLALHLNNIVVRLDLSSNFLNKDACYHLGQMLADNYTMQELVLSGCRIGSEGLRLLLGKTVKRSLEELDLSRNNIGDSGFPYLADTLMRGVVIKRLNLSHNELGPRAATLFAEVLEFKNAHTHLNLSWNNFCDSKGVSDLVSRLGSSAQLEELNLSWCSLTISTPLRRLLSVPTLTMLDLSNNRLVLQSAISIAAGLNRAKQLNTLNISSNPIPPEGAMRLLNTLKRRDVKLKNLMMENIVVNKNFVKHCDEMLKLSYRKDTIIKYGEVLRNYTLQVTDMKYIIMKRLDYLTSRQSRKHTVDIALYFLELQKSSEFIQPRQFMKDMRIAGILIEEELANGMADLFPGPLLDKGGKTIDIIKIVDMITRLWPWKKLPPTPPEVIPEPDITAKQKEKPKKGK